MTDTKKISELETLTILAADDILTLVDFDALVTKRMSVDGFFNFIPAGVNVGLGAAARDNWGLNQSWNTGDPALPTCGGITSAVLANWTIDAGKYGMGFDTNVYVLGSLAPAGGYPTSSLTGASVSCDNYQANSELLKMIGVSIDCRQQGADVGELYGQLIQASGHNLLSSDIGILVGTYNNTWSYVGTGTGTITTAYGIRNLVYAYSAGTAASAITTAYGQMNRLYTRRAAGSTATIGTAYNVYITDRMETPTTYGVITNYYGLYIQEPLATQSTNRWSIYSEGRHHFDQPTVDAAVPVLTLDQADISEGLINFVASDRGVIAGATASAVSVRVELDGTVYRLALYADA